jgi:lipopolysaccharide transport protein LptA
MTARDNVTTWMRTPSMRRCRPANHRAAKDQGASKVPRLLEADAPVRIKAPHLEYDSRKGVAIYSGGGTTLDQEATSISGERIVIDQTNGDLSVTGSANRPAVSNLMLDDKLTIGRAHEIRYTDEKRLITYAGAAKGGSAEASLRSGPDSQLQAGNIEITLNAKDNALDRMKASRDVRVVEGANTVTGGGTLDYAAATGEYVVKAAGTMPVTIMTREDEGCRRNSGNSITFNKEKNKAAVVIDGQQMRNAATAPSKVACTPSPAR